MGHVDGSPPRPILDPCTCQHSPILHDTHEEGFCTVQECGCQGHPDGGRATVTVSYLTVDEALKASMPRCSTCIHWRGRGISGICTAITDRSDGAWVNVDPYEAFEVETGHDFGCVLHTPAARPSPEESPDA